MVSTILFVLFSGSIQ